jgi:hypothetical protein
MRDLAAPFLFSLEGGQTHLAALFYFPCSHRRPMADREAP